MAQHHTATRSPCYLRVDIVEYGALKLTEPSKQVLQGIVSIELIYHVPVLENPYSMLLKIMIRHCSLNLKLCVKVSQMSTTSHLMWYFLMLPLWIWQSNSRLRNLISCKSMGLGVLSWISMAMRFCMSLKRI